MRVQSNQDGVQDGVYYLLSDHLGGTALTLDVEANKVAELRYSAWGETRYTDGDTSTQRRYTGQIEAEAGLYDYNARWYDPALGRFAQADTMIPEPYNPIDWNRYSYARNNPVKYTDPSGHCPVCIFAVFAAAIILPWISTDSADAQRLLTTTPEQTSAEIKESVDASMFILGLGLGVSEVYAFTPQALKGLSESVNQDGDPLNEIKTLVDMGKTLLDAVTKSNARDALRSGLEGLTKSQTQKALEIMEKGKIDSVSINLFNNGNSQITTKVFGGDGGSFATYMYN
jgi:RHS repeat-associated protein